jgi:hypothetical protein
MKEHTLSEEAQAFRRVACPHAEAVGVRWGDPISEERQRELQFELDAWAAQIDRDTSTGPIDITANGNLAGPPLPHRS